MMKYIGQTPLSALLPGSIRDDATVAASAASLDPIRRALAGGIPNILLWSRLDPAPGRLCPPLQRLAELGGGLKALSEAELELLAWQLHVDFREAAATREQLAAMVRSAIPWHRIKGTPASIKQALALFGYSGIRIEEDGTGDHWATWQLGLPEIADEATVRHIVSICNEMQPARCRLWRIYTDVFDRRPIVPDVGPVLDDGYEDRAYELNGTHRAAGPLRGGKYSKFDGGTRIPFLVSCPKLVHRGVSHALIGQMDLFASFAHMLGMELAPDSAVDSQDMYAALIGEDPVGREELMVEDLTCGKMLRSGNWTYLSPGQGVPFMKEVRIETGLSKDPQLYNMDYDIGQQTNVAWDYESVVKEMEERLRKIMESDRTR